MCGVKGIQCLFGDAESQPLFFCLVFIIFLALKRKQVFIAFFSGYERYWLEPFAINDADVIFGAFSVKDHQRLWLLYCYGIFNKLFYLPLHIQKVKVDYVSTEIYIKKPEIYVLNGMKYVLSHCAKS